jgi:hypothetical protein
MVSDDITSSSNSTSLMRMKDDVKVLMSIAAAASISKPIIMIGDNTNPTMVRKIETIAPLIRWIQMGENEWGEVLKQGRRGR